MQKRGERKHQIIAKCFTKTQKIGPAHGIDSAPCAEACQPDDGAWRIHIASIWGQQRAAAISQCQWQSTASTSRDGLRGVDDPVNYK